MIEVASSEDVWNVALRMRESDFDEFSAISSVGTREEMADTLAARITDPIGVYRNGEAVAIGAMVETRPNVATLLFFATDEFPLVALELTRFVRQRLLPKYVEAGFHRFECVSIEGHTAAHRWIKILGLEFEAYMPRYGRDGQAFYQFAWVGG